jgi:uncharacterized membrane protein YkoI
LIHVSDLSCRLRYAAAFDLVCQSMRLDRGLEVLALLVAAALVTGTPLPVAARDQDELRRDEVRQAVEAGDIRSLADILKAIRGKLPGEVAGVEIEHEKDRWRYELRVVDGQGRLFEVYVDARSGEIERIKEK